MNWWALDINDDIRGHGSTTWRLSLFRVAKSQIYKAHHSQWWLNFFLFQICAKRPYCGRTGTLNIFKNKIIINLHITLYFIIYLTINRIFYLYFLFFQLTFAKSHSTFFRVGWAQIHSCLCVDPGDRGLQRKVTGPRGLEGYCPALYTTALPCRCPDKLIAAAKVGPAKCTFMVFHFLLVTVESKFPHLHVKQPVYT